MLSITILGLTLASLSSAQSTVSLYLPGGFDPMPLVASILGSDSKATTYAVRCVPGTDENDCGMGGGIRLTQGPATAAYTISLVEVSGESTTTLVSGEADCSLDGTKSAVCVSGYTGIEANEPGPKTTTFTETDLTFQVATLASVSLYWTYSALPEETNPPMDSDTASSSGSEETITGTTQTNSASGTQQTSTATTQTNSAPGAQKTSSGHVSSTSTGGMAMVTGHGWVVGGAAIAAAML